MESNRRLGHRHSNRTGSDRPVIKVCTVGAELYSAPFFAAKIRKIRGNSRRGRNAGGIRAFPITSLDRKPGRSAEPRAPLAEVAGSLERS
jgi:hypothetical protein